MCKTYLAACDDSLRLAERVIRTSSIKKDAETVDKVNRAEMVKHADKVLDHCRNRSLGDVPDFYGCFEVKVPGMDKLIFKVNLEPNRKKLITALAGAPLDALYGTHKDEFFATTEDVTVTDAMKLMGDVIRAGKDPFKDGILGLVVLKKDEVKGLGGIAVKEVTLPRVDFLDQVEAKKDDLSDDALKFTSSLITEGYEGECYVRNLPKSGVDLEPK